jgi:hypothetical protein
MNSVKQFALGAATVALLVFLFRSFFCTYLCPPCPTVQPIVPNPTIEFNVENANFGVIANPVAGANAVKIDVFGASGTLAASYTPAIGVMQAVDVSSAQRPLQLVFNYASASNPNLAIDSLIIDDRQNGGNPPVEILIGAFTGSPQSCPSLPNNVTVTNITTTRSKFSWAPGKQYKFTVTHGGTTEEFLLTTVLNGVTGCYKAELWRGNKFNCLTSPAMANTDPTELEVTMGSGNVKITAMDNCDGSTPREVFIRFSSGGGTLVVISD